MNGVNDTIDINLNYMTYRIVFVKLIPMVVSTVYSRSGVGPELVGTWSGVIVKGMFTPSDCESENVITWSGFNSFYI